MTDLELIAEITAELKIELKDESNLDEELLKIKVKSAIRELKSVRRYREVGYSDAMIEADIEKFISQIKAVALYDYSKIGAEGQTSYSADGESIKYEERASLWSGALPLANGM